MFNNHPIAGFLKDGYSTNLGLDNCAAMMLRLLHGRSLIAGGNDSCKISLNNDCTSPNVEENGFCNNGIKAFVQ